MNKIISLHLDQCNDKQCPNRDVCYHVRKNTFDKNIECCSIDFRIKLLKMGYTVYESMCQVTIDDIVGYNTRFLLPIKYSNYNLTISWYLFSLYYELFSKIDKNQLQITVHDLYQAKIIPEYQKLFLIKDEISLKFLEQNSQLSSLPNMHYCLDQNFLTKDIMQKIGMCILSSNSKNTTVDSCCHNYIVENKCLYDNNYIDITFDGTLRHCPFNINGYKITNFNNIKELFNIKIESENCVYKTLLRNNHESKNPEIQHNSANINL